MTLSPDAALLRALRQTGTPLPPSELAPRLGLTLGSLAERVEDLRSAGFDIQLHPLLGYRLQSSSDRLVADDLWARLPAVEAGGFLREILVFAETSSTNDVAHRLGRGGTKGGVLILAESQTAGRGRFGRKWDSPPGLGIWFSLLLRPPWPQAEWPRPTTWTAVTVARAVESALRLRVHVKWPNDLYHRQRKLGGILIETGSDETQQPYSVVGVGLNANHTLEDFPEELRQTATSLYLAHQTRVDRTQVVAAVLEAMVSSWCEVKEDFPQILREASVRSTLLGHWVRAKDGEVTREGIAEALDGEGHLLLRQSTGELVRLLAGEVTLRE